MNEASCFLCLFLRVFLYFHILYVYDQIRLKLFKKIVFQLVLLKTTLCATVLDQGRMLLGAEDGLYTANLVDNSVEKVLDMK